MTREEKLYAPLDEFLKKLKKKIKQVYAPLYVSSFDQLNIIMLNKRTAEIYSELDDYNRKAYRMLAEHAREWAFEQMEKGLKKKDMSELVNDYLKGYDPVTQYVYVKEVDRKRMRLNESVLAAREYNEFDKLQKSVKKAADLWFTQSSQYAIDIMDLALTETFLEEDDDDPTFFMWNTVIDGRECEECHARNGKVYESDEYPPKPHYGCRCYKTLFKG